MATGVRIEVQGMRELERKLKLLTGKELKKVTRGAVVKGVRPAANEAKRIVRSRAKDSGTKSTGHFARNIAAVVKQYPNVTVGMVGARNNKDPKTGENPANIAHLLENGTDPHLIQVEDAKMLSNINDPRGTPGAGQVFGVTVQHPGTDGIHMFSRAFQSKMQDMSNTYAKALDTGITAITLL